MADSLAGVVLAAGAGTRLRPLTRLRPKVLCPVGNVALVDIALGFAAELTGSLAVNLHHGRELLTEHLAGRVHLSVEEDVALGTAGALGRLRDWIDGRPTLVVNGDTWRETGLTGFVDGWDGERIRLAVVDDRHRGDFGALRYVGAALLPWQDVRDLTPEPAGLYEVSWQQAEAAGRLDLVVQDGKVVPCDRPADYLAANLLASGGESVIGEEAVVDGVVERSVIWPGAVVRANEVLRDAIRAPTAFGHASATAFRHAAGDLTVLVR